MEPWHCVIAEGERSTVKLVQALGRKCGLADVEALCYRDGTSASLPGTKLYHACVQAGMIDESTIHFEDFSFGAFDFQLSQVSVPDLKAIPKFEWLNTILVDENDAFKHDGNMKREDVLEELGNGVKLFPDNDAIRNLFDSASTYYASLPTA